MLRLRQICLIARELDPAIAALEAVLGITTCHRDPAVKKFGLVIALLPIGNNFLEVVAPFRENTAAGRYLDRRDGCLLYTSPSPRDKRQSRMPSSA